MPSYTCARIIDHLVGAMIATAREDAGVTVSGLARRIGVRSDDIKNYESGRQRIPASHLMKVAEALGTPLNYLFGAVEIAECLDLGKQRSGTLTIENCARVVTVFSQIRSPEVFDTAVLMARDLALLDARLEASA